MWLAELRETYLPREGPAGELVNWWLDDLPRVDWWILMSLRLCRYARRHKPVGDSLAESAEASSFTFDATNRPRQVKDEVFEVII